MKQYILLLLLILSNSQALAFEVNKNLLKGVTTDASFLVGDSGLSTSLNYDLPSNFVLKSQAQAYKSYSFTQSNNRTLEFEFAQFVGAVGYKLPLHRDITLTPYLGGSLALREIDSVDVPLFDKGLVYGFDVSYRLSSTLDLIFGWQKHSKNKLFNDNSIVQLGLRYYPFSLNKGNDIKPSKQIGCINCAYQKRWDNTQQSVPSESKSQAPVSPLIASSSAKQQSTSPYAPQISAEPSHKPTVSKPSKSYTVQVGAFSYATSINKFIDKFQLDETMLSQVKKSGLIKLYCGNYSDKSQAQRLLAQLKNRGLSQAFITQI